MPRIEVVEWHWERSRGVGLASTIAVARHIPLSVALATVMMMHISLGNTTKRGAGGELAEATGIEVCGKIRPMNGV